MCDVHVNASELSSSALKKPPLSASNTNSNMRRQADRRSLFNQLPHVNTQQRRSIPNFHLPNSAQFRRCDNEEDSESEEEEARKEEGDSDDDNGAEQEHVDGGESIAEVNENKEEEEDDDVDLGYNDDGPLEKWGSKCKAKVTIIAELKKEVSLIHQYIPEGE